MQHSPEPEELAMVYQIDRGHGNLTPERRQLVAFTQAADILLDDLSSPKYRSLRGLELAAEVETALSTPRENDRNTTRLHAALLELAEAEAARIIAGGRESEDNYEEKLAHDPVFREIDMKIKEFLHQRSMASHRHAARRLHEFRMLSPEHVTARDRDWKTVIDRLFTS